MVLSRKWNIENEEKKIIYKSILALGEWILSIALLRGNTAVSMLHVCSERVDERTVVLGAVSF